MSAAGWTAFDEGFSRLPVGAGSRRWRRAAPGGRAGSARAGRGRACSHRAGRHLRLLRRGQAVPIVVLPDRRPGRPRRHGCCEPGPQRLEEGRGAEGCRASLASTRHRRGRRDEPAADRDRKRSNRIALVRRDRPPSALARQRRRARRAVPTRRTDPCSGSRRPAHHCSSCSCTTSSTGRRLASRCPPGCSNAPSSKADSASASRRVYCDSPVPQPLRRMVRARRSAPSSHP